MTTWTPEQVERLRAALSAGKSVGVAAAELGVSRNAAMGKASRVGMDMSVRPAVTQVRPGRPPSEVRPPKTPRNPNNSLQWKPARPRPSAPVMHEAMPSLDVGLMDLHDRDCHWPYGDGPFLYCGHPALVGKSYCGPHFRVAYQPASRAR